MSRSKLALTVAALFLIVVGSTWSVAATLPLLAPRATPARVKGPVRVGGDVKAPRKIVDVKPVYPEEAKAEKVEGVVLLEVTIATDGSVSNALVLRSTPLLDQAAIDAVLQWKFEPSVLDGEPIEVLIYVTINFALK